MAATLTEIANLALISIKKDPIKNLESIPGNPNGSSPNQKSGAIINVVIGQTIRWVQSKSRWSDLITKATLTLQSTTDSGNYVYLYPTNVLGYVKLVSGAPYEIQAGTLVTEDPTAELWYIRYSDNPAEWNAYLTEAIVAELAARIAPKLLTDTAESKLARERADVVLIDASTDDYTNRASPRMNDYFFELNQTRAGMGTPYGGSGDIQRLRDTYTPRR